MNERTPSFILELPLLCNETQLKTLEKMFNVAREIYNICLSEVKSRVHRIRQDERFKNAKVLPADEKYKIYNKLQEEYGMNGQYAIHKFVTQIKRHYNYLDAHVCQKLATRAYNAGKKYMVGTAKKLNFIKYATLDSIESKSNEAGIRFNKEKLTITYLDLLQIKVLLKKKDVYANEALTNRIKYCRIHKKIIRGKIRFYVQLILEGYPPAKRNKEGNFKHSVGALNDKVGIDIGPSTIAITSKNEMHFFELADGVKTDDKIKKRLQRKLDRSKRQNNPKNYNDDGTTKKGSKNWTRTKTYIKTLFKLKDIERKISNTRKMKHNIVINNILSQGLDVRIEKTDFKS